MRQKIICFLVIVIMFQMQLFAEIIDDFSDISVWKLEKHNDLECNLKKNDTDNGPEIQLQYDFSKGDWVQIKKQVDLNLSKNHIIIISYKNTNPNSIMHLKVLDKDGSTFGKEIQLKKSNEFIEEKVALADLKYFWGDSDHSLDYKNIKTIFLAVVKKGDKKGQLTINKLKYAIGEKDYKKPVKQDKYYKLKNPLEKESKKAAEWIANQQSDNGLILSYIGDASPFAWTYDQALALIVLSHEYPEKAKKLVDRLTEIQNPDGSWYDGYLATTAESVTDNLWVGSVAWVVHGINRYIHITGDESVRKTLLKAADWLITQQNEDGSFHIVTEGNLDCYWAMKAAGYDKEKKKITDFLLNKVWNIKERRFNVAIDNDEDIYFDPQSWGCAFLKDVGREEDGLYALGFAKRELATTTLDGQYHGFDTKGPYTVWNEIVGQWITVGGAKPDFYNNELKRQQHEDGSLQHSHEGAFRGTNMWSIGGTWHTIMKSVASTSWFYFANKNEPWF